MLNREHPAELARYGQGMASQQYDKEADRLGQFAMQKEANDINRSAANSRNALTMMETLQQNAALRDCVGGVMNRL